MMNSALLSNPIIMSLGWTLVHSLWLALVFALIVRIAWVRISADQAVLRYRIALLAMLSVLLGCTLVFGYYFAKYEALFNLPPGFTIENAEAHALYPGAEADLPAAGVDGDALSLKSLIPKLEHYFPLLVMIWLLGTVLMSIYLVGSWWYMNRLGKVGLLIPDKPWNLLFSELRTQMGIRREVRIYWSDRVREPITLRHLKPIVLFPIGLVNQLSMEQVEVILLHELSHIKRWDYLVNWLQSILELLFFYHPAVWWLSAQARLAREHCCDDLVLQAGRQQRLLYARTLTQVSAYSLNSKSRLVMSLIGNNNEFTTRIQRLFGQFDQRLSWQKPILSGFLMLLLLGFSLTYSPELNANGRSSEVSKPVTTLEISTAITDTIPKPTMVDIDDLTSENPNRDEAVILNGRFMGYGIAAAGEIDPAKIAMEDLIDSEQAMQQYGERGRYGARIIQYHPKWGGKVTPQELANDLGRPTTGMDVRGDFDAWKFTFGPKNAMELMDPLVIINEEVMDLKSELSLNLDDLKSVTYTGRQAKWVEDYGPKAADGVVFITTKKEKERALRASLSIAKMTPSDLDAKVKEVNPEKTLSHRVMHAHEPVGHAYENTMVYLDGKKIGLWQNVLQTLQGQDYEIGYCYPKDQLPPAFAGSEYSVLLSKSGEQKNTRERSSSIARYTPSIPQISAPQQVLENSIRLFPNPFRDELRIEFELPTKRDVLISIFDAGGRLVKVLPPLDAAVGPQSVTWKTQDLPSGTYTLILQSGSLKVSKQLIRE